MECISLVDDEPGAAATCYPLQRRSPMQTAAAAAAAVAVAVVAAATAAHSTREPLHSLTSSQSSSNAAAARNHTNAAGDAKPAAASTTAAAAEADDDDCCLLRTPPRIASSAAAAAAAPNTARMWMQQLLQSHTAADVDENGHAAPYDSAPPSPLSPVRPAADSASTMDVFDSPPAAIPGSQQPISSHIAATPAKAVPPATQQHPAVETPIRPAYATPIRAYSVSDIESALASPAAAAAAVTPIAAPTPAPLKKSSQFNQLVRQAKAHEEAGELEVALRCYEQMQPLKPDLESVPKKIKSLRKKIAAAAAAAAAEHADEEGAEEEEEKEEARMLPLLLDGKFAFDEREDVYRIVLPSFNAGAPSAAAAGASAAASSSAVTAAASTCLPSTSPHLSPFSIPSPLYKHIFAYQAEGLHWLYTHINQPAAGTAAGAAAASSAPSKGSGAILGDDMGLGKTVQVCAYISGLFFSRLARRVLIVAPISVLSHWESELAKWCGARKCEEEEFKGREAAAAAKAGTNPPPEGSLRLITVYAGKRTPKQRAAAEAALERLMNSPSSGGIVLTSYGQLQTKPEIFCNFTTTTTTSSKKKNGSDSGSEGGGAGGGGWDLCCIDEGHKIKNPDTILHQNLRTIPTLHRLLLTGTPVMNDLDELWSLMDWVMSSRSILGSRSDFRQGFSVPILAGLAKGASEKEQAVGAALTRKLKEITQPHLLRREKEGVRRQMELIQTRADKEEAERKDMANDEADARSPASSAAAAAAASSSFALPSIHRSLSAPTPSSSGVLIPQLTAQKNDWILWLHLTPLQDRLYRLFLGGDSVKSLLVPSASRFARGPLPVLSALKKLCDHPRLLDEGMEYTEDLREDLRNLPKLPGMDPPKQKRVTKKAKAMEAAAAAAAAPGAPDADAAPAAAVPPPRHKEVPVASAHSLTEAGRPQLDAAVRLLCAESLKFAALESLLRMHSASGHRTLIFSQSLRMLAFVTLLLQSLRLKFLRIDGTVNDPGERQRRVDLFNRDESFQAFMLTTRAGGVGINRERNTTKTLARMWNLFFLQLTAAHQSFCLFCLLSTRPPLL